MSATPRGRKARWLAWCAGLMVGVAVAGYAVMLVRPEAAGAAAGVVAALVPPLAAVFGVALHQHGATDRAALAAGLTDRQET